MRPLLFLFAFTIAAVAVPLVVDIDGSKHLQKRGTDDVLAAIVKAALAFGAFVWGGGIIGRKTVDYYLDRKAKMEAQQAQAAGQAQNWARIEPTEKKKKKVSKEEDEDTEVE
jgi:hypothetical protein